MYRIPAITYIYFNPKIIELYSRNPPKTAPARFIPYIEPIFSLDTSLNVWEKIIAEKKIGNVATVVESNALNQ